MASEPERGGDRLKGPRSIGHDLEDTRRPVAEVLELASQRQAQGRVAPTNLPVALSSFVGRAAEKSELRDVLRSARLVTLTGSPGVGKTRLAIAAAVDLLAAYPGGAWLVDLAPLDDGQLVPHAVVRALGVAGESADRDSLVDGLIQWLQHQRVLLVLDNCEHLLAACAFFAEALLEACPLLAVLATSRERLGVDGEAVWQVSPLALPGDDADVSPDALLSYESVRLFVERATATRADFRLDEDRACAVADICRRLDGLPLAIELAAARVGVLSVERIAQRLDDRFQLLARGSRTALARHQTLAAALQWSYDLLSPTERLALRELSVFARSFSLDAAQAVLGAAGINRRDVFDVVASLIAKSLVVADLDGREPRYQLLESIRQFGQERLAEAGEETAARSRHATWCAALAARAAAEGSGRRHQVWSQWLEADHDNIRAALEWSLAQGWVEQTLHLAMALTMSWTRRGQFTEARRWLARALPRIKPADPDMRVRLLATAGSLAFMTGDFAAAQVILEETLPLAQGATRARALKLLGISRVFIDHPLTGLPLLEESVELAREAGERPTVVETLALKGRPHLFLADTAAARAAFEESLREAEAIGAESYRVPGLLGLGWTDLLEGKLDSADALLREALALCADDAPHYDRALARSLLADVAAARGETEVAKAGFGEAEALARLMQAGFPLARSLLGLGRLALREGDLLAARTRFEEAMSLGRRSQLAYVVVRGLHGLGDVAEAVGDAVPARAWLDQALALARDKGDKQATAAVLLSLGRLGLSECDDEQTAPLLHEALALAHDVGDPLAVAGALELVACLAAVQRRLHTAVRLFAAVDPYLEGAGGTLGSPLGRARREEHLGALRRSLSKDEFAASWAEGAGLSLEEAVSYARRGRGTRQRAPSGWDSLTRAERAVVELVKLGLSNAEIGARLFVSPRTVQWHLSAVFRKVGVRSRGELTREALLRSG